MFVAWFKWVCLITLILGVLWERFCQHNGKPSSNALCWKDVLEAGSSGGMKCRLVCSAGGFSIAQHVQQTPAISSSHLRCHAWIGCDHIERDVKIKGVIAHGVVKKVYLAEWNEHLVVYSELSNPLFHEDFQNNVRMLQAFTSNPHVTQLLGFCGNVVITEYHKYGDARNLHSLFESRGRVAPLLLRFKLCIDYARILTYLHDSPMGKRVMCDSNTLDKTLSQFLLREDMTLIVNDLDALPAVNGTQGIKCGHKQLHGDFVAPEQQWPYKDKAFNDSEMPGYDEMSDIWKIPDVCLWFLGKGSDSELLTFHLHQIHRQCKNKTPRMRPSAREVLKHYEAVWNIMNEGQTKS